jgi:hypothetical protein
MARDEMQRTITAALAAALVGSAFFIASAGSACAQGAAVGNSATELSSQQRLRPVRTRARIVVTPSPRVYRRCLDWYAVERRATGDTVVPNMRCWWAYR